MLQIMLLKIQNIKLNWLNQIRQHFGNANRKKKQAKTMKLILIVVFILDYEEHRNTFLQTWRRSCYAGQCSQCDVGRGKTSCPQQL